MSRGACLLLDQTVLGQRDKLPSASARITCAAQQCELWIRGAPAYEDRIGPKANDAQSMVAGRAG